MAILNFPDSKGLRTRAEQCRLLGYGFRDPAIRARMLRLAVDFEQLAESATLLEAARPSETEQSSGSA